MVVEGNDAGRAGTNHPHFDPLPQAHFLESHDKIVIAIDLVDPTFFTGTQEFKWDKLLQVAASRWVTDDFWDADRVETQSQVSFLF